MAKVRVLADVRVNLKGLDNLVNLSPAAIANALGEVTGAALDIAKDESRVDTGAMKKGWRRSQIGFKGSIKTSNTNPGYRIYNNTLNKYDESYTQYHEFGTARIEPQPMLEPAMRYISENLEEAIASNISDAIDGSIFSSINVGGPMQVEMED
jgi:HK97 gp10 family phage protein